MKNLVMFSLVTALAAPAFAATAAPAPTPAAAAPASKPAPKPATTTITPKPATTSTLPKALTDDQRAKLAIAKVRKDLAPWVSKNTKVTVRAAIVPFDGDTRNPITGAGPIKIFVTQQRAEKPGFLGRMRQMFNPFHKQTYLVNVGNSGDTQILERVSLAPQRQLARFVTNKLALGALASDFMHSGKITETLFTAAGATGAAAVSPLLSGALFMRVAQVIGQGISSQTAVRKTAMDQTVAWAQTAGKTGEWPTLMESYREYQANIEAAQAGARPLGLCSFVTQLSINRL